MSNENYSLRKTLTFKQAEGSEPLPSQLEVKTISNELRASLWSIVYPSINLSIIRNNVGVARVGKPWVNIMYSHAIEVRHIMVDEFDSKHTRIIDIAKSYFDHSSKYGDTLGFIQFVMRHVMCPNGFSAAIDSALERGRSAYRVFDENTIVPINNNYEIEGLRRAFADLEKTESKGAKSHLRSAGAALTKGQFSESVRESIHAVESVSRALSDSNSLGDALNKLEKSQVIHPALKKGFSSIYGYTSDENGIRHPLIDDDKANVDESDALFMIGSCASFVSYMINKARISGIL